MVIKGKSRAGAGQLAGYLLAQGKNERVELKEISGTMAQDIGAAFREMEAIAKASQCEKFLYHASINPKAGEHLTPEQWALAVDALEKKIGLEGHQRAVVEHVKDGRSHYHIVWNRVDVENFHAVKMSYNYLKHEEVSRDLERQFGLDRVQGAHAERDGQERPSRKPKDWEIERGKRTRVDTLKVTREVSALWEQSDSGKSFAAGLEENGYMLAQHRNGRDIVIVDSAGSPHGIGRRTGATSAEVRAKLADIERDKLPTVDQAKEMQKAEREKERAGHLAATLYDRADMASMNRDAMRHAKDARQQRDCQQLKPQRPEEHEQIIRQQRETDAARAADQTTRREELKNADKPRNQQEAARKDKQGRTELTDAQLQARQKDVMREMFETKHPSAGVMEKERFERERER